MPFLSTFRGRLVIILALLLVATLGVQYLLNLRTQQENYSLREKQERAIVAGFAVGISSVTSPDRIRDLIELPGQTLLDEESRHRIQDIIVVDNEWRIFDCLAPENLPSTGPNGETIYRKLSDLKDLPPLLEGTRLGTDIAKFPNGPAIGDAGHDGEAHAIPIETSKGRWYVMVLLYNDKTAAAERAAQPLLYTLGILLISSLITILLVFRFTRPIADISRAAREVADGNLSVRVDETRTDELGRLASNFNEMTAELEKKTELEAKLQQAEKSAVVGRLGSAIAHEIRNPLNYINLTLDHLRSKFAPAEDEKKAKFDKLTLQLKEEVARINRQITDFLNYSRPATATLRPIDARQAVEDSLRIIEGQAEEKGVLISVSEHENVPQIIGDPQFLRSVFNNLFINAVQAMEATGGKLNVRISESDDRKFVKFEITDTGGGIPQENLESIFEPYFSTKETGTGLGLAIVKKIVEIHSGEITVRSTLEKGTTFTILIPAATGERVA
ncbi:MAG: HAMP domain-containing protein [Pyrinomonadaceae bacterium]|nr:HAMP domain-containing protein [Pyrinomonadaceae bacterium]